MKSDRQRLQELLWHVRGKCQNPNNCSYHLYGGKGIKVCEEWLGLRGKTSPSLDRFCEWALANGYQPGLVLDRLNHDGDFEPSNCIWVTEVQVKRSRRGLDIEPELRKKLFAVLSGLRERCRNPKKHNYKNYGGRGIKVCDEWVSDCGRGAESESAIRFYKWALASGYQQGLSIDRINPNGDYSPDNCRWATPLQQSRNRTYNKFITVDGERMLLVDASRRLGVCKQTVSDWVRNKKKPREKYRDRVSWLPGGK